MHNQVFPSFLSSCILEFFSSLSKFVFMGVHSRLKTNPVYPVNPVKKNICGTLWSLRQNAFMQNEPKRQTAPFAVSPCKLRTTNSKLGTAEGKNEPKTNPNEPKYKPFSPPSNPKRTHRNAGFQPAQKPEALKRRERIGTGTPKDPAMTNTVSSKVNEKGNPVIPLKRICALCVLWGKTLFSIGLLPRCVYNTAMKIKYFTDKGSVYMQTQSQVGEYWVKEDADGVMHALAGAVPIARARLQELIDEYPRTLLDRTLCFNVGAEKEFFEDAQRERFAGAIESEPTVIFFLVKAGERYAVGCSSEIERVEVEDSQQ